jgi:hypothetical protein
MSIKLTDFNRLHSRQSQRGVALILVAIGLVVMLGIAGLALDASHALTNKTRLQNTTDAAALAAAKEYDQAADIVLANAAALSIFGINADGAGNQELNAAYDAGEINILIQWSDSLDPFTSKGIGPYVRVIATGYNLDATLSAVLGIDDIGISASAVAGPSPTINRACNVAPLVACANDPDDSDMFGFTQNKLEVLKASSGGSSSSALGPGNFQLIRMECGSGKDCVRDNLAGAYNSCISSGTTVDTEPGNGVGPSYQGLNTRFDIFAGPMKGTEDQYPPDVITEQTYPALSYDADTDTIVQDGAAASAATLSFGWDQYAARISSSNLNNPPPRGVYERRVLTLPIARCDGTCSGQCELDVVGFGCYFLLQEVVQQGTEANIFGQFIESCTANGTGGPDPGSGPGLYLIQLYKDPGSGDS